MGKLKKILKVTAAQYDTLVNGGSISVGGVTYTYDANTVYLTPDTSITDFSVNGTSIVSSGTVNLNTKTAYNAATNKLATAKDIPCCVYGYCSSSGSDTTKYVNDIYPSNSAFNLTVGSKIMVNFVNANTVSSGSLNINVNSTGAYPLKMRRGTGLYDYYDIYANDTLTLYFDGNYWLFEDNYHNDGAVVVMQDINTSNSSGWRLWSNGWVEQWGTVTGVKYNSTSKNVTFTKTFANANYLAFATPLAGSNYIDGAWVTGQTTTQMIVHTGYQASNTSGVTLKASWYAAGQIA